MTERDDSDRSGPRPATNVRTGPGIAADATTYVTRRLLDLSRYAPRPIDTIDATVTTPRDRTRSRAVEVRATLTSGRNVLRARRTAANLGTAMHDVHDRLRRQLVELPHGSRKDYVPHRRTDMNEPARRHRDLRVRHADVNGRHPWVLEDDAGIVEVTESLDVLADDHPEAHITTEKDGSAG
ncbi:MAG TPA: HPF/RaiA family ribosome-associated protein [Pseudonocardiaceae bacterium]|nr:HPF/RaiA family ribosome-associated protein [Pseudonocardiaceae bacterium]